jgi:hypothetical protein
VAWLKPGLNNSPKESDRDSAGFGTLSPLVPGLGPELGPGLQAVVIVPLGVKNKRFRSIYSAPSDHPKASPYIKPTQ